MILDKKGRAPTAAATAILETFNITVTPQTIGQMKKKNIYTCRQAHEERRSKRVKHIRAAEIFKVGLRKKVRRGRKNTVPEDHHEGITEKIKWMQSLNFKVPLFVVIQRLVCIANGAV